MYQLAGQRKMLLNALQHGPMTTGEIRNELGIGMPATRIFELRDMGYKIRKEMVEVVNRIGQTVKVARYTLVESDEMKQAA